MQEQNQSNEELKQADAAKSESDEQADVNEQLANDNEDNGADDFEKVKAELDEYKSKYYYVLAEMENARKRSEREKEQTIKFGSERILRDLIDVVDNFERTINMLKNDEDQKIKNIVFGLDMVSKQFIDSLKKSGLEVIESLGKDFDPNFHEALAAEYAPEKKENEIIAEHQKGYILNGRLLRASKVVVAKTTED
jgi:molecular chaperone GrpE